MAAPTDSSRVPPPDVTDWPATPAPFNTEKHGKRAVFSGENSVVRRRQPTEGLKDCVAFLGVPLPVGLVWQITVVYTIPLATADKIAHNAVSSTLIFNIITQGIFHNCHFRVKFLLE